jgi:hypothetical protein
MQHFDDSVPKHIDVIYVFLTQWNRRAERNNEVLKKVGTFVLGV